MKITLNIPSLGEEYDNRRNEKLLSGVIEVLIFTRIERIFADVSHS